MNDQDLLSDAAQSIASAIVTLEEYRATLDMDQMQRFLDVGVAIANLQKATEIVNTMAAEDVARNEEWLREHAGELET